MNIAEVIQWVRELRRAGHVTPSSANSMESACWVIGRMVPEQATVSYITHHLDDLLARYAALHPGLSKRTVRDYGSRIKTAVRYFEHHQKDPAWKPRRRILEPHDLSLLRGSRQGGSQGEEGQIVLPRYVRAALERGLPATMTVSGRTVRLLPEASHQAGGLAGSLSAYAKGKPPRNVRERVAKEVAIAAAHEGRDR